MYKQLYISCSYKLFLCSLEEHASLSTSMYCGDVMREVKLHVIFHTLKQSLPHVNCDICCMCFAVPVISQHTCLLMLRRDAKKD